MPLPGSTKERNESLFRIRYEKYLARQFATKSLLLQMMGRQVKKMALGEAISIPVLSSAGMTYTYSSAGRLPAPSTIKSARWTIFYAQMALSVLFPLDLIEDAMHPDAAETDPVILTMQEKLRMTKRDFNYDLIHGDGSGKLTDIVSASSGTQFIVSTPIAVRRGIMVDVLLKSNGSVGAGGFKGGELVVNRKTGAVTIVNGVTFADGSGAEVNGNETDYAVYRADSYGDAVHGLASAINDTGTYGLIDRSLDANDWARANVLRHATPGTGRLPTFELMAEMRDMINSSSEIGDIGLILTGPKVYNYLISQKEELRRFGGREMTINGWARGIDFLGTPLTVDYQMSDDRIYFLTPASWNLYEANQGNWMDKDGSIFSRVEGFTAYRADWAKRCQPFCRSPISNGVILDLDVTAQA